MPSTSISKAELEQVDEGQSTIWDDAIPMLEDQDHRIRNRGVNVLLHRLSQESKFQLLQQDEEAYREGFALLLDRVEDQNYTVRMFAVTALAVVLEATEGREQYEDIYGKSLIEIFKAIGDNEPWVSVHANDIVQEMISDQKKRGGRNLIF
jgi:hypothetical protein